MKHANTSSNERLQSALLFGAPINIVRGEASRKTRMLYIISVDGETSSDFRGPSCSSGESLFCEDVPCA